MSSGTTLSPQIIGQAEKTLNAILYRLLAGPGLTEAQWITLTLIVAGGESTSRDQLAAQVAHALKVSTAQAQEDLASLTAAQLVQDSGDGAGCAFRTALAGAMCIQYLMPIAGRSLGCRGREGAKNPGPAQVRQSRTRSEQVAATWRQSAESGANRQSLRLAADGLAPGRGVRAVNS